MSEWISVRESLPKVGEIVLCSCISRKRGLIVRTPRFLHLEPPQIIGVPFSWEREEARNWFEDQCWMRTAYLASSDHTPTSWDAGHVTHWMSITEPPEAINA